jgi:uncharacterized protein (DUF58 family)
MIKNDQKSRTEGGGAFLLKAGVPVLFLFYFFTPQRTVQFLALFLVILVLGSKAYSEYLVRHLRLVRRDRELRAFRNEWLYVELLMENSGRLPAFMLALGDSSGGIAVFRNIKCLCTLGGKSRQLFRWEAYGSERGVYSIGPASIRGSDPLGLFPFVLNFAETSKLFVYPAPAFAGLKSPGGIPLGNLITPDPFYEDLTRPRSLRDYSPGDESKRINWKASARTYGSGAGENLLVNEYEPSLSYPMVVFLNADPLEYAVKNRELYIERVIEAAAALCLMAARERQTLGLILHTAGANDEERNSAVINPAAFTLIPILERLAALEPFRNMDRTSSHVERERSLRQSTERLLEKGKALAFGTRLVYAGPSLEEADYNALETLRKRRLSLEYLIINEKSLESGAGNKARGSRKYQMKDMGYAIL